MTITRSVIMLSLDDIQNRFDLTLKAVNSDPLPTSPGVYVHTSRIDGAVLYVGSAAGSVGLRRRLRDELRWIAETRSDYLSQLDRRTDRAAVIAGLVEHDTSAFFVETSTTNEALQWERRIIHLSVLLTGAPPYLRGWNVRGTSAQAFEWVRARLTELDQA